MGFCWVLIINLIFSALLINDQSLNSSCSSIVFLWILYFVWKFHSEFHVLNIIKHVKRDAWFRKLLLRLVIFEVWAGHLTLFSLLAKPDELSHRSCSTLLIFQTLWPFSFKGSLYIKWIPFEKIGYFLSKYLVLKLKYLQTSFFDTHGSKVLKTIDLALSSSSVCFILHNATFLIYK